MNRKLEKLDVWGCYELSLGKFNSNFFVNLDRVVV